MATQEQIQKAIAQLEEQSGCRVSRFNITPDGFISNVTLEQRRSSGDDTSAEQATFEAIARSEGIPASLYGRLVMINSGMVRYRISGIIPGSDGGEPLLRLEALQGSVSVPDIDRRASQVLRLLGISYTPSVSENLAA